MKRRISNWISKALIRIYGGSQCEQLNRATHQPEYVQKELLFRMLRRNADTAFGKKYRFASVDSMQEFKNAVPIQDYEGFRDYVDQTLRGEKHILTYDKPVMLAMTSGTTSEPKYIPVTNAWKKQELSLIAQWFHRALGDHPDFLDHDRIAIVSPAIEGKTDRGIPVGSTSGMAFDRLPHFIQKLYAIPRSVTYIKDYDVRYFVMARLAAAKRVSFIITPNPSTLIRFSETMAKHQEVIIRSIYDGKLGASLIDQPEILAHLSSCVKPDLKRARFLSQIVEKVGCLKPMDVWPELKLISCWLGGSVGVHAQKLKEHYGASVPIRDLGYCASEGRITSPYEDDTASGILTIQTNFYEFIPEEELCSEKLPTKLCHELEVGKRYAIILTTPSGLYRYDIKDIVEVTGFYNKTPALKFVRKGRDMTNITGEKVHVNHILFAMEKLKKECNLSIEQFRAAPNYEKSLYEFYIEPSENTPVDNADQKIVSTLDSALAEANIEYAQKRRSRRLYPPYVHIMRRDWAEEICRNAALQGKKDSQYKWQALLPEKERSDDSYILRTLKAGGDLS